MSRPASVPRRGSGTTGQPVAEARRIIDPADRTGGSVHLMYHHRHVCTLRRCL